MALISDSEVRADRAFAEAQLPDQVRIVHPGPSGGGTFNDATGQYDDPPDAVVVYEGPARFQIRADINTNIVEPQELDREWAYQTSTLQLPIEGTGAIRSDDVATCTAARYDEELVGRVFNIQAVQHKSMATTRKFRLREAVR
jgi:hypothetical protein